MGDSVPSTRMLLRLTFSIVPPSVISNEMAEVPRLEGWPKNWPDWKAEGFTTQLETVMLRKPPLVSVPSLMALQWLLTMQF